MLGHRDCGAPACYALGAKVSKLLHRSSGVLGEWPPQALAKGNKNEDRTPNDQRHLDAVVAVQGSAFGRPDKIAASKTLKLGWHNHTYSGKSNNTTWHQPMRNSNFPDKAEPWPCLAPSPDYSPQPSMSH